MEGKNNETQGSGATPASGKERVASIERGAGTATANEWLNSKTRSAYNASGSMNYDYISVPGEGWGGNVGR